MYAPLMPDPTSTPTAAEGKPTRSLVSEDWLAVWIGSGIIALVLLGVRPEIARFGWSGPDDLFGIVLAPDNLSRWLQLGVLLLLPAAVGARLMGARLVPFVIGFAVLYGLALRSGPRNLDSGLSEISIVFQAAVPKLVASKYTTSGVRRPSEL